MYGFFRATIICMLLSTAGFSMAQERLLANDVEPHPVVVQASELLGAPYRWGGTEPRRGFDCSGLVQYVFGQLQVSVPRMPADIFRKYISIPSSQLLPGDVVFFNTFGKISHVGIYLGDRRFIHAPRKGLNVSVESMDSTYYRTRFAGARRLIPWPQSMLMH